MRVLEFFAIFAVVWVLVFVATYYLLAHVL
jgi:hypothetical protein